jgi:aspartyl-tRNA(Asn)/glutamyl-tRNA(Gln) amidotransferase subunit B
LSEADATLLVEERETAEFYEEMAAGRDKKLSANWLGTELFGALNKEGLSLAESPITAESLGRLMELISDGTISGRIAKDVFVDMFESGEDALDIVERKGLTQISDAGAILELVESVIYDNASKVAEFRNGKDKLFGFFVGQVMKKSQGKANPKLVNNLLKDKLG